MKPETETRGPVRALDEFEEHEVDAGRYWRALVMRWWLPAIGLVLGVVIGLATSVGGGRVYEARAVVYLGQPFFPGSPQPILSVATNFTLINELAHSDAVVREIGARLGVDPIRLRNGIVLGPFAVEGPVKTSGAARLVSVVVNGLPSRKALQAADLLAARIVRQASGYVDVRLATYRARADRFARELTTVKARIAFAEQQQAAVLKDRSLPALDRLVILGNFNNVINVNEQRRAELEGSQLSLRDQIALAEQIESARILERATVSRLSAGRGRRADALVGALIGLLAGTIVALLWEPVAARVKKRPGSRV